MLCREVIPHSLMKLQATLCGENNTAANLRSFQFPSIEETTAKKRFEFQKQGGDNRNIDAVLPKQQSLQMLAIRNVPSKEYSPSTSSQWKCDLKNDLKYDL